MLGLSFLDKLQSNLNLFFKVVLKRQPGYDVCWVCGTPFIPEDSLFCEKCGTFKCSLCGSCFCDLPLAAQKALDAELYSIGLWNPYGNPCRRKRRKR